ncbi:helix-turn-helix transcriptional regulator [Streptomyces sp. NBC_01803]|uniref:helix-turn-helix transcriptional regulator n=1 Tax=Streptomyces sp. NBC_01803 TaxID=2975946 RepID=UPI002DD9BF30|nr:helix-turn-helix transcriptional regulator [Streptomyces sp. NBC_01803]WSA44423.1 helix-turn-helix transcriptional regulator [Streptomyces sp. NBC_01803]
MAVLRAWERGGRNRDGDGGAADGSTAVFELLEDELDAVAVRVYQLRVTHPTDLVSQLAARAGFTADEVAEAERLLSRLGLLQPSPGGGWVAVSPESAAEGLLAPLEQDVLQRRIAMAATREQLLALSGEYLEARSMRSAKTSIEIVEGLDNIRAVIDDLARTCAESLDALIPGGVENEAAVAAAKPLDLELLSRGVRIRSLFQHAARRHRVIVQYVETITSAGAEVRSISVLPSRMLIYDGACALLPLDPLHTSAGAALVRDPAVLSFLCRLFEHCWGEGVEFAEAERERDGAPSGLEREVLLQMASGRTNEEIAQRLGVSQRSVSRIVAGLMTRLGATNRFQAGTRAAASGWLT